MGKNGSKKAARHARITQDFFNQVPESSTGNSAKTSAGPSSISLPTHVENALGSFVNTANSANPRLLTSTFQAFDLSDDYRQAACLLGERIYHTFERNKDAARDLLRHLFTTAYLIVNKSTGRREWRLDTDIKYEIVQAIHSTKLIGLFTHQRPIKGSNPARLEHVIDGPTFLDEFDVIGIIVDFFLDWSVECADFLREHPDLRTLDVSLPEYRDKHLPFACIGIIEIAAAIKTGKSIDLDPRPYEFFFAVRMNKMADEQNLFIQGKDKKVTRKNKDESKVKATEPTPTELEHTAEGVGKKQVEKEHVTDTGLIAKGIEKKHVGKKPVTDTDLTAKGVEKKQVGKEHDTDTDLAAKDANDEDGVNMDNAATATAAAESTVTNMQATAETVKDHHVNKATNILPVADADTAADTTAVAGTVADTVTGTVAHPAHFTTTFTTPVTGSVASTAAHPAHFTATFTTPVTPAVAGTAAPGLNIPVTSDNSIANLVAGARGLSINDSRPDDPYGLRARNREIRRTLGARGFYMNNNSTANGDDPLNLRARSRLPQASATYVDPFTDADGPTSTGAAASNAAVANENPPVRRGERLRASTANPGATTSTSPMTATDASGTPQSTVPPRRVRAGRRHASAATTGPSNTSTQAATPRETAAQRLAKNRLYQELQDLVNTNFPSAAARRTAFAQARQRLLQSETVAAARGEQPLRPTATRATQEALTIGRDDALNAVRQQRAAEAARMRASGAGTEANARAREQGFGFDIGGMGGWHGELEAMQALALRKKSEEKGGDKPKEK